MLFKEIIAVFLNHMKPINRPKLCWHNAELFIVKADGIYHCGLKGYEGLDCME
jgi:hypothetical protein